MTAPVPEAPWLGHQARTYAFSSHLASFLKWRFSLLPSGAYRYAGVETGETDEVSEIHISMDFPVRPEIVNQRPAISVFRSAMQFQGLGLGDTLFSNPMDGSIARADLASLTYMVGVLSRVPAEAETLSWVVMNEISAFRGQIVKSFPDMLYFGQRMSMSPASPPGALLQDASHDWTAVILSIPTYLSYKHIFTPLNRPIVNNIGMTLTTVPPQVSVPPAIPLQGTSIMQPAPTSVSQPDASTAESTSSPLSVKIEIS